MKKQIKITLLFIMIFFLSLTLQKNISNATTLENLKVMPYTQEYQDWLALPEDERNSTIAPPMYETKTSNVSKSNLLRTTVLPAKYDLRSTGINIPIRDQGYTSSCWAFSSNTALETNILKKRGITYDFSEKYLEYSTSKFSFLDGINNNRIF